MTGEHAYERIAGDLRREIAEKKLLPDETLPSEHTLAARYRVARTTARRAIAELVAEGLILSIAGKGHIVRASQPLVWVASHAERNVRTDQSPADVWSQNVREHGRVPSERITVEKALADDRVAGWLALEPGAPVVVRRRIRYVDEEEYQTADSYYPLSIVAGTPIEMPGDILPGVYAIYDQIGRPWVDWRDRIVSRAPTREEAQLLHIPRGVQVTEIFRRSYDVNGIPVRLTIFVLPQDRNEIEYEIEYEAKETES